MNAIRKQLTCLALLAAAAMTGQAQSVVKTDSLTMVGSLTTSQRVGYSHIDLKSNSGAVDKVTEDRMNKGLVTNSLDALSGQAAGVQVTTGGNQEAMVSAVRVRGTTSLTGGNDPLVLIDGVTADLATLSTIYPADIESFTILKDASETAQYGSRGAAGVIQVATKRGKAEQFHISYDGNVGFESIYKNVEMLDGPEFRQAAQKLGLSIIDKGANTNFRDAITRTGFVQNHHVAFGGGTESSYYRASIGLMEHKTIIETNRLRNYIAKFDIHQKAFDDYLTVDLGVFGSIQKNNYLPNALKLFYSAATFNPTFPEGKNAEGGYDQVTEAWWINNPLSLLEMKEDEDNGHFSANLRMSLTLAKGLTLTGFGSYSYNTTNNAHYYPTTVWSHGEAYRGDRKSEELLADLSLNYIYDQNDKHFLDLLLLTELESEKTTGFYTTASNFTTNAFGYNNLSAGAIRPWEGTNSYYWDSKLTSFLARVTYRLLGRYSLTLNARTDGSSKVGKNNRWGFFPSVSGAWNISDEAWMRPVNWVSNMKLRMGYGRSGNLGAIDSYLSQQLIRPNGVVSVGGTPVTTLGVIRNANPDLRWEIKRTFNVGLDMAFWSGRVVFSLDYYRSKTTDMLYEYDVPVPPFTYDKLLANLGSMKNSGLELGFGITPLRNKDMELSVNMNWTFERNRLISLNGDYNGQYLTAPEAKGISALYGAGFHGPADVVMQMVGEQLGVFYLPHCNGLVKDADGSYYYDVTDEKRICGQATPKATMGSNIAFRYRQWDITVQTNGAFGHKIYNGTALTYNNMLSLPNYNVKKGAPEKNIQDQTISDYWLERGDYLNIDYVTLGWNIPLRAKNIQRLRISLSVNNLATITSYSGLTPMINSSVVSSTLGVDDKYCYPVYRSYTCSLSIQF